MMTDDEELPYGLDMNHEFLITEPKDVDKVNVTITLPDENKLKFVLHVCIFYIYYNNFLFFLFLLQYDFENELNKCRNDRRL